DRRDLVAGREAGGDEAALDGALVRAGVTAVDEGGLGCALVAGAGGDAQAAAVAQGRAVDSEAGEDQRVAAGGGDGDEVGLGEAARDLEGVVGHLPFPEAPALAARALLDGEAASVH